MNNVLEQASSILPYKIIKRISKTGEGRSGDELYKRRNSRSYRGVMQYVTWDKLQKGSIVPNILENYKNGYIVWISPEDYFGTKENYPAESPNLNRNFILGQTGFVYYKNSEELSAYPALDNWHELYELSTKSCHGQRDWVGEVCFNIKNAKQPIISDICRDAKAKHTHEEILSIIRAAGVDTDNYLDIPTQCGIGNYDFDYANEQMIEDVKLQMLYMILTCEDKEGENFGKYLLLHKDSISSEKDTKAFRKNIQSDNYLEKYKTFFKELQNKCNSKNLLDFDKLEKINSWDRVKDRPICPLCSRPLNCEDFFKEIEQQEGRKVFDNTQREVVLMHVKALRSGLLNHKTYNLSWGHNFCNTIQGDRDIEETIDRLKEIIKSYDMRTK